MALNYFSACAALVAALASTASADCESFGIDYQSGGTYFQNIDLNETFTAMQKFTGCANDTAHNVLVDPNGDQSECSETPLLPDNTPQQVVCSQYTNPELYSGDWSLLIVSNNGDEDPIAYQRDFYLDVGKPNVTVTVQSTATSTVTSTTTVSDVDTITTTYTPLPTLNAEGKAVGSTTTGTDGTVTATSYFYETQVKTITSTKSCTNKEAKRAAATSTSHLIDYTIHLHPSLTLNPDPILRTLPTVLGDLNALASSIACAAGLDPLLKPIETALPLSAKFKKDIIAGRKPSEDVKRAFVEERAARLAPVKRSPDSFTTTVYSGEAATTETTTNVVTVTHQTTTVQSVAVTQASQEKVVATTSMPTITEYKPYTIYKTTTSTEGVYTCNYA